ncbi:isopeptide-forming domain-containing fimbrial protein [Novosphingobium nitrogenifigens]|nr:isopeptide-forming domain-containing fimbrial protein [Novosphingobium nitrogenifigens]
MGLFCLLAALIGGAARAQTITNTAYASWPVGGQTVTVASNTVSLVETTIPITVNAYVASPTGSTVLTYHASQCSASATTATATTTQAETAASYAQASVTPASAITIGDAFYFQISMPQGNLSATAIDQITVVISTRSGDRETLTVAETGINTGLFAGSIATAAVPPQPVAGDCTLSVADGDIVTISPELPGTTQVAASTSLTVLSDPAGEVFDSSDGTPINGATVTIVDATTLQPAKVYGPDGTTTWPSTVQTGGTVTDGNGVTHTMATGEYSFPKVAVGSYRLQVTPPSPYTAPSKLSAAQLSGLTHSDGTAMTLIPASWGNTLQISSTAAVRVDIPADRTVTAAKVTKTASVSEAQPGDLVHYTVTVTNPDTTHAMRGVQMVDVPSSLLRLRKDSVRIDGTGAGANATFAADGSRLTVSLGTLAAGAKHTITYAASVRNDASQGRAQNTVTVTDITGTSSTASALVRVTEDGLASRMTLVGEVTEGGCSIAAEHRGIPGVRVMLEDGSFAITDRNGRYHFDGIVPGTHVVAVAPHTLPEGGRFIACHGGSRAAGSATSRFVIGQGGALMVANFHAQLVPGSLPPLQPAAPNERGTETTPADPKKDKDSETHEERVAAGAETDWLAMGNGPTDFLFPATDHNPRAPAIRVVIRHRPNQTVELSANGTPVPRVMRDAVKVAPDNSFAVSIWRGVPLEGDTTELTADVRNADGSIAAHLARTVHFNHVPFAAQIVPSETHLVADGRTRPVVAVRIVDRNGRPVHAGISGDVTLSSPYESADAIDMQQSRALSGLGRASPHWTVKGEDGIARIELAPTMASGALQLDFAFVDNDQRHSQTLESWVKPGKVDWTLVGLAEGSLGARTIADNMEKTGGIASDLGRHARAAFYAKGRILGKFLLTLAYDSAKQTSDQTLMGTIDPRAYYTVYGDGTSRRFDAASRNKLYLRIETATFYAIFGDVEAGFNQTRLAHYQRTATGVKAEAQLGRVHLQGFGARTSTTHRHDEIAGTGLSGPYPLSSSAIILNSETVSVVVRDRFRPDVVLSTTTMTLYTDYTLDAISGTITFKQPLLSRDASLNPQYAVIDYDIDPTLGGANALVGAGRADYTTRDKRLRIGATAITDAGDNGRSNEAAADLRLRVGANTEIRAEGGVSTLAGALSQAWLIEGEHHDKALDVLAYARSADQNFGVGQTSEAEVGHRRIGVDLRRKVSQKFAIATSLWTDTGLQTVEDRKQGSIKLQYRDRQTQANLGVTTLRERDDTTSGTTTLIDGSLTHKLLDNRLEVTAASSIPLGNAQAASLPVTETVGLRYAINSHTRVVASYEQASSSQLSTATGRVGLDMQPWRGSHVTAGLGDQAIAENGQRTFAAFGLSQSLSLNRHVTLDTTVDSNRVLAGSRLTGLSSAVTGISSSTTSGSTTSTLVENFTAVTAGIAWRKDLWSTTLRAEWRDGEWSSRHGMTLGAIRQLGDGRMVGTGVTWTHAQGTDGTLTDVLDATLAMAWRPHFAMAAWLARAEYRSDFAQAGTGTTTSTVSSLSDASAGSSLTSVTSGNAHARRLIVSVSSDWSPRGHHDDQFVERSEVSLFAAIRHNFDAYDGYNLSGTTVMAGISAHIGLGDRIEIGGQASVRANVSDGTTSFAVGPSIGVVPAKNMLLMVGYNLAGYRDADFSASNNTRRGVFASMRLKFDTSTFGFLGLDRGVRRKS